MVNINNFEKYTGHILEDVKPQNIMFTNKHSNEIVIIDFGGAAGYNDGINIYSDGFVRTSLLNQIRFGNRNFIKENP